MSDKKYDDTNRGALFVSDRKQKETDRDYSGTLNIEGREYWISGWKKKDKNDKMYLSISIKAKDSKPAKADATAQTHGARKSFKDEMDGDEIPFSAEFR